MFRFPTDDGFIVEYDAESDGVPYKRIMICILHYNTRVVHRKRGWLSKK